MSTSVMTLREYADMLTRLADGWEDEQPAVLIGDMFGDFSISAKDGFSSVGVVGYAQECFDGNGVWELGQADTRFYGTMLIDQENLGDEAREELQAAEWDEEVEA